MFLLVVWFWLNRQSSGQWFETTRRTCDVTVKSKCLTSRIRPAIFSSSIIICWYESNRNKISIGKGRGLAPAMWHYSDVIMDVIASQITSLAIVYSTVYSSADQRKHESSASLAFVWGIHRGSGNSPHKWPVTRIMVPFDDVIMTSQDMNQLWASSLVNPYGHRMASLYKFHIVSELGHLVLAMVCCLCGAKP